MKFQPGIPLLALTILLLSSTWLFAHNWEAPPQEAGRENPVPLDETSISAGKALFAANCMECHGESAQGRKAEETGLAKDTGNLPKRLASHSPGDFFWKIQNGRGDMPSFKDELSETETWQLINYIGSLGE